MENKTLELILDKLNSIEGRLTVIEKDMKEVKNRITFIENDHGMSLKASLDGYSLLFGLCKDIQADVRSIKDRAERHDHRIFALEYEKIFKPVKQAQALKQG